MTQVINIVGLSEVIDQYDLFIIDQWGVLHNGQTGYHYAIDCVENLITLQKKLIIRNYLKISTSSKNNIFLPRKYFSIGMF